MSEAEIKTTEIVYQNPNLPKSKYFSVFSQNSRGFFTTAQKMGSFSGSYVFMAFTANLVGTEEYFLYSFALFLAPFPLGTGSSTETSSNP